MKTLIKNLIHKYFVEPLGNYVAWKVTTEWRTKGMQEMAWEVFSTLGMDELEKAIEETKKKKNLPKGSFYETLSDVYAERLRNMSYERLQKVKEILDEL